MGVSKTISRHGHGAFPKEGDKVVIEYTGYLKDTTKTDNKGTE
jgi:FKBP-type peptidyl-prolyl cis-trans isomerase